MASRRASLAFPAIALALALPAPAHAAPASRDAIAERFAADPEASRVALDLFDATGDEVDVLPAERFDGGYRGKIDLVPALPVGAVRPHLQWVAGALHDFDAFFTGIAAHGALNYRWRGLSLRFFRSVGNTTPNAFAWKWTVAYNVNGSIDTSADRVRETLFHEIFHLDDASHGDWSPKHLAAIHEGIERKCGTQTPCLAPYAPTPTIVRRGTYYSFQPGNDVHEYAAEVALRWYTEQRAALRGERAPPPPPPPRSFKCGPAENRRAWEAVAAEFFGGVDLVPGC